MTSQRLVYMPVKLPATQAEKLRAIQILMDSGQKFTALSELDYVISQIQCKALTDAGIKYKKQSWHSLKK